MKDYLLYEKANIPDSNFPIRVGKTSLNHNNEIFRRHWHEQIELLYFVEGEAEKVRSTINELVKEQQKAGKRCGVIGTDESLDFYQCSVVKSMGSREDELTIAQHLYAILREFDQLDVDIIYSESFETPQMGHAIMNRLIKAAGHQIINV